MYRVSLYFAPSQPVQLHQGNITFTELCNITNNTLEILAVVKNKGMYFTLFMMITSVHSFVLLILY